MSRWMLIIVLVLTAPMVWSRNMERGPTRTRSLDFANPQDENHVLFNGRLAANFTNYGFWGNDGPSQSGSLIDPCSGDWAPQFEYPVGSEVNYLYQGALWVGAEIETDTGYVNRVSVGTDGWQNPSINEYHAGSFPGHGIVLHSNLPGARDCDGNDIYNPAAKANYEAVAVYTDTLRDELWVVDDPDDGEHIPLGLEITQTARLWKNPEYARFVVYEYKVKNIGSHNLRNVYLGHFVDSDVGQAGNNNEHTDDLSGSLIVDSVQGTILGWSADNDGYPDETTLPPLLLPHAIGVAALTNQIELGVQEFANSFNWYRPNANVELDFGPEWMTEDSGWVVNGTPEGDFGKYHLLSNRERDFDESTLYEVHEPQFDTTYACISDGESHAWHEYEEEPLPDAIGWDTRFLLSYGPLGELDHFDNGKCITRLNPGEEFTFTTVMLIGENFHDADNPQMPPYIDSSKFDFTGLMDSYHKAKRIYDSNYEYQPMPPVPYVRVYQAMDAAVQLRWEEPGFGEVEGYLVAGKPDSGRGAEVQFTATPIQTTHLTITNLTNGEWWNFVVYALDQEGGQVAVDTMIRVGAIPNTCVLSGSRIFCGDSLWWTVSNDPHRTGYKLVRTSAADTIVIDNLTERTYVDSQAVSGRTYTYLLYINNALGVEGQPSNPIELTPFMPTANILVLDETKAPAPVEVHRGFVDGDSARAFYERVMTATGESFDYFDMDVEENLPTLEQLGRYEIVFAHQDNSILRTNMQAQVHEALLRQYVEMGGKLIRCGRYVLGSSGFDTTVGGYEVTWGTLTFDSIRVARRFGYWWPVPEVRTTGATAVDTLFPDVMWDSTKVHSIRFFNVSYEYLSEIDLMWPNGNTHSVYTAVLHEDDSTGYVNPPCAVIGPQTIFFGFPVYFVPELQAQQIIETSLYHLRNQALDTPEPPEVPLPTSIQLHQNYPNPFNASTVIEFELPTQIDVKLNVYNIRGQLVTTLVEGSMNAGYHRVAFTASRVASGLYFYRLEVGNFTSTKKMLMIR